MANEPKQMTFCEGCGRSLPHDDAIWMQDGNSMCRGCYPLDRAAALVRARNDALEEAATLIEGGGFEASVPAQVSQSVRSWFLRELAAAIRALKSKEPQS